jgi:hypothetical protein
VTINEGRHQGFVKGVRTRHKWLAGEPPGRYISRRWRRGGWESPAAGKAQHRGNTVESGIAAGQGWQLRLLVRGSGPRGFAPLPGRSQGRGSGRPPGRDRLAVRRWPRGCTARRCKALEGSPRVARLGAGPVEGRLGSARKRSVRPPEAALDRLPPASKKGVSQGTPFFALVGAILQRASSAVPRRPASVPLPCRTPRTGRPVGRSVPTGRSASPPHPAGAPLP